MDRTTQKRKARHARSANARHDRLVTAYLKKKYPEAYDEAERYYNTLNLRYPTKRDLTKTADFLQFSTGYSTFIEYYRMRSKDQKQKKKAHTVEDNMTLQIPLMDSEDVCTTKLFEKADQALAIPDDVYDDIVSELRKDPQLYTIFDETAHQAEVSQGHQVDETTQQPNLSHEHQFAEVIEELDEILPQLFDQTVFEKTPLEEELSNLTYQ